MRRLVLNLSGPLLAVTLPLVFCVSAGHTSPIAESSTARVYAANCGTVGYLEYKPKTWSAGCTSGSPEVEHARWVRWSSSSARGVGRSYVENCTPSCAMPNRQATYPSSVVLSRPVHCTSGAPLAYFSRARWTITYPSDNPFHQRPRKQTYVLKPLSAACQKS
jgi:hypothetical protein